MTDRIRFCLRSTLCLAAAIIPVFFLRQTKDCFILPKFFALHTISLVGAFFIFTAFLLKRVKITLGAVSWQVLAMLVYTVLAVLSVFFSPHPALALGNLPSVLAFSVLYICAHLSLDNANALQSLGKAAKISVVAVSVYAFLQYFGFDFFAWHQQNDIRTKAFSTFGNPQILAVYLAGVVPFVFADFLSRIPKGFKHWCWTFTCFASGVGTIYISHTRSATLACLLGCAVPAVMFVRQYPKAGKRVLGAFALCAVAGTVFSIYTLLVPVYTKAHTRQYKPMQSESIKGRIFTWARTIEIIKTHPWLGTGPGTFEYEYPKKLEGHFSSHPETSLHEPAFVAQRRLRAHNDFLQIAAQNGIPAALVFLLFCVFLCKNAAGKLSSAPDSQNTMHAGTAGALAAYLFIMLFHFVIPNPAAGTMFFIFAGAVSASAKSPEVSLIDPTGAKMPKRLLIVETAAVAAVIVFLKFILPPLASDMALRQGHTLLARNKPSQAQLAFERSAELNPASGQAYVGLGISLAEQHQPNKAMKAYNQSLKTLMSESIYYAMGLSALKQADPKQAQAFFEKALNINPFFPDARLNLGVLQAQSGQLEKARNTFKTAASTASKPYVRIVAYTNLGILETRMENHQRALYYWQYARELNRNNNNIDRDLEDKIANTLIEFF